MNSPDLSSRLSALGMINGAEIELNAIRFERFRLALASKPAKIWDRVSGKQRARTKRHIKALTKYIQGCEAIGRNCTFQKAVLRSLI